MQHPLEIQLSAYGGSGAGVQWSVWQHRQAGSDQEQQQQQELVQVASGGGALGQDMYLAAIEAALQQDRSPARSQQPTVLKVSGGKKL